LKAVSDASLAKALGSMAILIALPAKARAAFLTNGQWACLIF
jgi:hypothetical protein